MLLGIVKKCDHFTVTIHKSFSTHNFVEKKKRMQKQLNYVENILKTLIISKQKWSLASPEF